MKFQNTIKHMLGTLIISTIGLVSLNAQVALPVSVDFSEWHNGTSWTIPSGWDMSPVSSEWQFQTSGESFETWFNGFVSVHPNAWGAPAYTLTSPVIDVTTATSGLMLSWNQSLTMTAALMHIHVMISIDGGAWDTIHTSAGLINNQAVVKNLSADIAGHSNLQVKWSIQFASGELTTPVWSFDDILIRPITAQDARISLISSPSSGCGLGQEPVVVSIRNMGTQTITQTIPVSFSTDGGNTWHTENYSDDIPAYTTSQMTFAGLVDLSTVGNHEIIVKTALPGDELTVNDALTKVLTNEYSVQSYPDLQDFETSNGNWFTTGFGSTSSWEWGTPSSADLNSGSLGSTKAWATDLDDNHIQGELSYLYSGCYDFTNVNLPVVELDLWYIAPNNAYGFNDGMLLQYTTDFGQTWTQVGNVGTGTNWYNMATGWFGQTDWMTAKHELPTLANQGQVKFRLVMNTPNIPWHNAHDGYAFDNFKIYDKPAFDVGISEITKPESGCGLTANEFVRIKIKNYGTQAVSNVPVRYQIEGESGYIEAVYANSIAPSAEAQYIFYSVGQTADLSTTGIYNFTVYTALDTDGNHQNDSLSKTVVSMPTISSDLTEDFEDNDAGLWVTYKDYGTVNDWEHGTPTKTYINNTASGTKAWVTNLNGYVSPSQMSYVESPCYDLSSISEPALEFKISLQTYTQAKLSVEYSLDNGLNWFTIPENTIWANPTDWYTAPMTYFSGDYSASEWQTKKRSFADISDLNAAPASVKFRVKFEQGSLYVSEGAAFDDFRIYSDPTLWSTTLTPADLSKENFQVVPNPANESIQVSYPETFDLEIYNTLGQMVLNRSNMANSARIDVSFLEAGIYTLKVNTPKGLLTQQIVKQ